MCNRKRDVILIWDISIILQFHKFSGDKYYVDTLCFCVRLLCLLISMLLFSRMRYFQLYHHRCYNMYKVSGFWKFFNLWGFLRLQRVKVKSALLLQVCLKQYFLRIGFWIKSALEDKPGRVDIWRDRWDRRSHKFFCELCKFLGKQREMLYNFTPKLRKFTHFA